MKIFEFTTLTILIFLVSCNSKVEKNKYEEITSDQIIKNYYKAVGGYEKIKKIETLIKKWHYVEPAYNIVLNAVMHKKRPNFRVIGASDFEEGYNGTAWEYHPEKGLILSEGEAKKVILISSDFDYPFIDAEKKGHTLSYKGITSIGGSQTHDVEITINVMNTKYVSNYYFDTKSHLLVGQRKVMPIHAVGPDVDIMVYYSDYRNVEGVLIPFSYIERNKDSGKFLNAAIWSEVIPNKDIPNDKFDPSTD